jgi:hypothetical protein
MDAERTPPASNERGHEGAQLSGYVEAVLVRTRAENARGDQNWDRHLRLPKSRARR